MRKFAFLGLAIAACVVTFAQSGPLFDPGRVSVVYRAVENSKTDEKFKSNFTLINQGGVPVPASGWSLYFNSPHPIDLGSVTGGMSIEHVNGDFYRLHPGTGLDASAIPSGSERKVDFVSGDSAINFTDAPVGLFWVLDSAPAKGMPVADYRVAAPVSPAQLERGGDQVPVQTAETLFRQNSSIVDIPGNVLPKVFPTPVSYKEAGGSFPLDATVSVDAGRFVAEADFLTAKLKAIFGDPPLGSKPGPVIHLVEAPMASEAYTLDIDPLAVTIKASGSAGIFYGIESFLTVLPGRPLGSIIALPTLSVTDAPRFANREFLLDVARNFKSKQEVLRLLDVMALYKLNVFHFHLDDDEGWRIEIPALPELTQVGSRRGFDGDNSAHLSPSFGSGPDLSKAPGSGFYSRSEFIDILRYAAARHIEVIPEIESPGHARAAVKSMDFRYARLMKEGKPREAEAFLLHDPGDRSVYSSIQMWNDNVMDIARPSTYAFLETVVDQIASMYRDAGAQLLAVHLGGDEAPAGAWERSPAFAALMKEDPSIHTTADLWEHYYLRLQEMLRKRGLVLDGWEEMGLVKVQTSRGAGVAPNPQLLDGSTRVDVWNTVPGGGSEDLAYRMANSGYKVVLSCASSFYLDLAYAKAFDEYGYYWGGYVPLEAPFKFIPYDATRNTLFDRFDRPMPPAASSLMGLTDEGKANILGIQGSLWGENLSNPERMEHMLLPRLLAVAERAWAKDPAWAQEADPVKAGKLYEASWSVFANIVGKRELPRLDNFDGGFAYRVPPVGATVSRGAVIANLETPGLAIHFTTDGSEPQVTSPGYSGPILTKGLIRLRAFDSRGRGSLTTEIVHS